MKRMVSVLLTIVVCFTTCAAGFMAGAENAAPPAWQDDTAMQVKAENSFGGLVAAEIDEKAQEQAANNGYTIFSVGITGQTALAEIEALDNCTLVIGIYDESGTQMLASGRLAVTAADTEVAVDIDADRMPDYFYVKAFLVDSRDFTPLCTAYTSPNYTRDMQEFFSKTTADFDSGRVLNLDGDSTNNFAVYRDDVKIIAPGAAANTVTGADAATNTYVIENADSTVTSLETGDTFSYTYAESEILIVKIARIEVHGNTVTITGEDTTLEDVFDYVKLDGDAGLDPASIDPSACADGVVYEGMVQEPSAYAARADISGSLSAALKYSFNNISAGGSDAGVKLNGGVEFKLEASIKLYLTTRYQSLELKLDYTAKLSASVTGKTNLFKLSLATVGISPVPGVYIELTPSFVLEVSAKLEISGTLKGTVGFCVTSDAGMKNLTGAPKLEAELKGDITLFVGFSLEPRIAILSKHLAEAKLDATVGAEAKGTLSYKTPSGSEQHDCTHCVDGDISAKVNLSFEAKLLSNDKWKFTLELLDWTYKICDFYWSLDYGEFAFTTCPHIRYRVTVTVLDASNHPAPGAAVRLDGKEVYTADANGQAIAYLPNGSHTLMAGKGDLKSETSYITVKDSAKEMTVKLKTPVTDPDPDEPIDPDAIRSVSLGGEYSAAITEGGDLYTWGHNYLGKLGNGTTEDSLVPIKIMNHVKSFSLGYTHSAAITEDGSLYMWGNNLYGQLGNGSWENSLVPIKIMSDVQSVSLGDNHSAAITEDGTLYMWGDNEYGQLGNGAAEDSRVPIKIMEHVTSVSLGAKYSAAITEGGDLYTWGYNYYSQLGNGTTENSFTPIKIMEHVKSISCCVGDNHNAAITEDGSLYVWGRNYEGQLGDGSTENSSVPIKIMEHVKLISLDIWFSAAITEDGDLYTWGYNYYGQLGNGSTEDSLVPIKIMTNIQSISLGYYHSAAITKNGSLYMWGDNKYSQLGNGTTDSSLIPIKTMDHVKSVSLGLYHGAAIAEDGSLYMWGYNEYGQLGNGTIENSSVPIRISVGATAAPAKQARRAVPATADGSQTAAFTGFTPGSLCNVYVMKSRQAADPFAAGNLLYIDQATADENGRLSLDYIPTEAVAGAEIFATEMPAHAAAVLPGDVDGNGKVEAADALMALQAATNKISLTETQRRAANVDGQKGVTAADALLILQYATRKITHFPVEAS